MTIIVTGAAGFIGANIVQALNARGEKNIIAVDDLRPADKYRNLADLDIIDYLDKDEFLEAFRSGKFGKVKAVFHEGACSEGMFRGQGRCESGEHTSHAPRNMPGFRQK